MMAFPPPESDALSSMVAELQGQFDLDADVCQVLLEDFCYDLAAALHGCKEILAAESTPPPELTAFERLCDEFPTMDAGQVNFYLEASGGDLVLGRSLCAAHDPVPDTDALSRLHPELPPLALAFWLDAAAGDVELADRLLTPPRSRLDRDFPRLSPTAAPPAAAFPRCHDAARGCTKKKKKKKKYRGPNLALESTRRAPAVHLSPIDELTELGAPKAKAAELLALCGGDIERAANMFLAEQDSLESPLGDVFQTLPRAEIDGVLTQCDGDIERAAAILSDRLTYNPPAEDAIIAIRPDLTTEQARTVLRRAHGDVNRARRIARVAPPLQRRGPTGPLRTLFIDLHRTRAVEALALTREALRNGTAAGDIGEIRFCTGRGAHSPGHSPVLRPLVLKTCRDLGYPARVNPTNCGVVICSLVKQ
jgi:hypothetical protein